MSTEIVQQKYITPDGKQFDTKREAQEHLRRPQIVVALNKLDGNNTELTEWLADNRDEIEGIFDSTKIRRVTKSERNQLSKALEAIKASGEKAFSFVIENADAIRDSFRWPTVKRVSEEEQATLIRERFVALAEGDEEIADWIIDNREQLLEAFQAGVVKREVNPKAMAALAEYRARQAAAKAESGDAAADASDEDDEDAGEEVDEGNEEEEEEEPAPRKRRGGKK